MSGKARRDHGAGRAGEQQPAEWPDPRSEWIVGLGVRGLTDATGARGGLSTFQVELPSRRWLKEAADGAGPETGKSGPPRTGR